MVFFAAANEWQVWWPDQQLQFELSQALEQLNLVKVNLHSQRNYSAYLQEDLERLKGDHCNLLEEFEHTKILLQWQQERDWKERCALRKKEEALSSQQGSEAEANARPPRLSSGSTDLPNDEAATLLLSQKEEDLHCLEEELHQAQKQVDCLEDEIHRVREERNGFRQEADQLRVDAMRSAEELQRCKEELEISRVATAEANQELVRLREELQQSREQMAALEGEMHRLTEERDGLRQEVDQLLAVDAMRSAKFEEQSEEAVKFEAPRRKFISLKELYRLEEELNNMLNQSRKQEKMRRMTEDNGEGWEAGEAPGHEDEAVDGEAGEAEARPTVPKRRWGKQKEAEPAEPAFSVIRAAREREIREWRELDAWIDAHRAARRAAAAQAMGDSELAQAKKRVLERLKELRKVEPKDLRAKEFRNLMREWHPDKNLEKKDMATVVFQFLQEEKIWFNFE